MTDPSMIFMSTKQNATKYITYGTLFWWAMVFCTSWISHVNPPPTFSNLKLSPPKKRIQIHPHPVPPYRTFHKTKPFGVGGVPFKQLAAGMFLFLITQSHITADVLGKRVFGHHLDKMGTEDPVAESFETATWSRTKTGKRWFCWCCWRVGRCFVWRVLTSTWAIVREVD